MRPRTVGVKTNSNLESGGAKNVKVEEHAEEGEV